MSVSQNSSARDDKYEELRNQNKEFVKEVVNLRNIRTQMQSKCDYFRKQKMEADFREAEVKSILSTIERRSKTCVNKIVECSTELSNIIMLAQGFLQMNNGETAAPISEKKKSDSCKQIVTPHAVNGHVIHTPTIRITRFNEQLSEEQEIDNNEEGLDDSDGEMNEDETGNGAFAPGGDDSTATDSFPIDDEEEDEHFNDANESENEESVKQTQLQTILEESPMEEDIPSISGTLCKGNNTLNQSQANKTIINKERKRSATNSSDSDSEEENISMFAQTRSSNGTLSNMELTLQGIERLSDKVLGTKKPSFAQRKSIGSPVPQKIARRSGSIGKRRLYSPDVSCSISVLKDQFEESDPVQPKILTRSGKRKIFSPDVSACSSSVLNQSKAEFSAEGSSNVSKNPGFYLEASSVPSCSSVTIIEGTLNGTNLSAIANGNAEFADLTSIANVSNLNNIEKDLVHSTPLCKTIPKPRTDKTPCKITKRRGRKLVSKELVVQLERSVVVEELIEKSFSNKKKSEIPEFSTSMETKQQNVTNVRTKKSSIKKERITPSKNKIVKMERMETPSVESDSLRERPKRAAKPLTCLREPLLNKKMRRQ